MRWANFSGGVIVGGVVGFLSGIVFGGVAGVTLGGMNALIDFCSDDGARRYIHIEEARSAACR